MRNWQGYEMKVTNDIGNLATNMRKPPKSLSNEWAMDIGGSKSFFGRLPRNLPRKN